jgi:antitoxin (DNA-binding transcriptional repressor) of toxin-antitoxin stability system
MIMTYQVKVNEAKARLLELVEAALKGEDIVILDEHAQMVKLVPVRPFERHPKFGSARGLVTIGDDFDAPRFR